MVVGSVSDDRCGILIYLAHERYLVSLLELDRSVVRLLDDRDLVLSDILIRSFEFPSRTFSPLQVHPLQVHQRHPWARSSVNNSRVLRF
jgi:hypothetical protein